MGLQYSTTLRNNQLDQIETTLGTGPILSLFSGSPPANAAAADSGTLLCSITLPSDWMGNASNGSKSMAGTWSGTGASGAGSGTAAGYFRIKDSSNTTCHMQGTVTGAGGGGDLTLDNNSIANGQTVSVTSFTITRGNA